MHAQAQYPPWFSFPRSRSYSPIKTTSILYLRECSLCISWCRATLVYLHADRTAHHPTVLFVRAPEPVSYAGLYFDDLPYSLTIPRAHFISAPSSTFHQASFSPVFRYITDPNRKRLGTQAYVTFVIYVTGHTLPPLFARTSSLQQLNHLAQWSPTLLTFPSQLALPFDHMCAHVPRRDPDHRQEQCWGVSEFHAWSHQEKYVQPRDTKQVFVFFVFRDFTFADLMPLPWMRRKSFEFEDVLAYICFRLDLTIGGSLYGIFCFFVVQTCSLCTCNIWFRSSKTKHHTVGRDILVLKNITTNLLICCLTACTVCHSCAQFFFCLHVSGWLDFKRPIYQRRMILFFKK